MLDQHRFCELWHRLAPTEDATELFLRLANCYSEPQRAYHNIAHIVDCLTQFDAYGAAAAHSDEVELAIWFHDAVYDSRMANNEEQSAIWAAQALNDAGVDPRICERVKGLILATNHSTVAGDPDEQLLVDIDLSILGREWEVFDRYDHAIRKEYAWVAEDRYRQARADILRQFMSRARIFRTPGFYTLYEFQARDNLGKAIQRLEVGQI